MNITLGGVKLAFAPGSWRRLSLLVGAACVAAVIANAAEVDLSKLPPVATRPVDFVKDIQPIFANHCYGCHGPKRSEAAFRLDAKEVALQGGELGPAIILGKSAESLLIHAVSGAKAGFVMPKKGERLSAGQIGLLRAWIDQGAHWPDSASVKVEDTRNHWAFKPPIRPPVPRILNLKSQISNPIDAFILARLEKENLQPSPEAGRVTLVRRLSLDLLGLPPTPAAVDEFVNDPSADAYEKLVERLLASPHYGERWGRHWLDAARYADSNGYEKDRARSIWAYRDYVISAFNRDLPFDRFTLEQLAGDLLPDPTLDQRVATGFLRNSMLNQEGGIEPEQFRIEAMIDRMDAVGRAWLGLTIACAQCHNHKFDPISQKEYYQVFAFLNNDDEPFIEVPTGEQQKKRDDIRAKARRLEDQAMRETTNLVERLAAWEKSLTDPGVVGNWTVLDPVEVLSNPIKFEEQSDHSLLGGGDAYADVTAKVWVETPVTNITGFRLEALTHPNLPYGGPGILGKGTFLLTELTVEAYALHNPTTTNRIKFRRAVADLEPPGFGITNAMDGGKTNGGWSNEYGPGRKNHERRAVFECAEPFAGFPGGTKLVFTLYEKGPTEAKLDCATIGRFRLSATTESGPLQADPLTAAQRKLLALPADQRTPEQRRELFNVFRQHDPALAALTRQIDNLYTNWPYASTTLALQQREEPRATHIFKRGDRLRLGDAVQPDVPAVLHPLPKDAPRNRLGFAQWLVDRRSPTTARVLVNRIWQAYFGQGLFTTPEDIGTRVDPPSHPELLDWLACEFMEPEVTLLQGYKVKLGGIGDATSDSSFNQATFLTNGTSWSFKHLHRLIVTSATYRQSSKVAPELYAADQYNRWLARGPRFRVESDVVQDIALAVSGLLNPKIGGPSVYPPIPASVGDTVYGGFSWPETKGEDRYRRGLYTFWKRSLPFPALMAFDAPTAENSCTRRVRSNTPLQALTTLNERTFVEAAQAMGLRVMKEGGRDDRSRATFAFRLGTGRAPTEKELASLLSFWGEQYKYFEDRTAAALTVALADPKTVPPDVNLHKVAAWAMMSRAILNLDETMTKE